MKKNIIKIAFIVLFLEIFIFNFSSIKSLGYQEKVINNKDLVLDNIHYYQTTNQYFCDNNCNIEFKNSGKVHNIYLDIISMSGDPFKVTIDYTDSANQYYEKFQTGTKWERYIVNDILKSKYIELYSLGSTNKIKINLSDLERFKINKISVNKREPLHINYVRVLGLFLMIFIIYHYFKDKKFKKLITTHQNKILFILILLFSGLTISLYYEIGDLPDSVFHDYYEEEYVEALTNGKLSIKENVELNLLNNPYDYSERVTKVVNTTWDVSYYHNNYYIYFGILPAFFMAVVKVIFHIKISTLQLACFFSIVSVIFGPLLVKKIIEKYTNCSAGLKLSMITFFLFNSRLLLLIPKTRFYELINISGFAFSLIGIYLYLLFEEKNKKMYLFLGSIFLSLLLFIRPQMILISVLGLYIIHKKINKNNIICFFPFIISAIITMYLNYVRFGNVFEFGITYQLGILDNHYSKFNIMSVMNGIYAYLFRVPIFDTVFPYVFNNNSMFEYIGFYFNTTTGNGILPMSIFGLIAPFIVKKTDQETNKFIMVCLILGIIILCIDSMFGGSLKRYSIEFAWLFLIPMILIIIKDFKNKKLIILFVLISCFMNFLVIFDLKHDDNIPIDNRNLYYELMYF